MLLNRLEKKWVYIFYCLDSNKDGMLSKQDLLQIIYKVFSIRVFSKEERNLIQKITEKTFMRLCLETESEKRIRLGSWMFFLSKEREMTSSEFLRQFRKMCVFHLFNLFDLNGDGRIDRYEFRSLFQVFGIKDDQLDYAFNTIDKNEDGYLSRKEINDSIKVFLYRDSSEEDQSNYKDYIFGSYHQVPSTYMKYLFL